MPYTDQPSIPMALIYVSLHAQRSTPALFFFGSSLAGTTGAWSAYPLLQSSAMLLRCSRAADKTLPRCTDEKARAPSCRFAAEAEKVARGLKAIAVDRATPAITTRYGG